MEAELRDAFKEQRDATKEVHTKVDSLISEMHAFVVGNVERGAILGAKIDKAHMRLDDHLQDHKDKKIWWLTLWGGMILAVIGTFFEWIKDIFGGRK